MAVRPIIDTLRHIEGGVFLDDASDRLAELVKAVDSTGKPGSLTMKIDIRPATKGAKAVRGQTTIKKPAEPPMEVLMFDTPEGNLLTEDPAQSKLDLKPVRIDEKPAELKVAL